MPWKQNPSTGESYWVDDAMPGAGTESGATVPEVIPPAGPAIGSASPTVLNDQKAADQRTRDYANPSSPSYKGPAYDLVSDASGTPVLRQTTDPTRLSAQLEWERSKQPAPGSTNEFLDQGQEYLDNVTGQTGPETPSGAALAAFQGVGAITNAPKQTAPATNRAAAFTGNVDTRGVTSDSLAAAAGFAPSSGPADPAAPTVNRANIDPLLQGINTYGNDIYALSKDNTGLSAAEAQLAKATELANVQAGIQTDASQRAALGQARSARNRGDRAFLEQQAIGEAGFIGQEAARTKALTDATARGDLANLRATEADADRRFRLDALSKASELGLNTAALEIDISKADLGSLTNMINQQFGQLGLDKQLDVQKSANVMNFMRDMATIQFKYDELSVTDQNEADRLLMQKYDIDQDTMVALKKIKEDSDFDWSSLATSFVSGAASGATAAIAKSDERAKTNIEAVNATAQELDELMGALGAYTYEYKDPEQDGDGLRFGFMAQELEATKLGKHMVKPDNEGYKTVEIAPLALATASGLALVAERLKALEKGLR